MDIIKRDLLPELKEHLVKKEISLIIGSRQVGKTTLMYMLKDYLQKKGGETLFLNLDNEMDRQFFASQDSLIKKIRLELGQKKGYVFIDEIQRKQDAGLFLKGIYDLDLPYKFIVSGSGSLELKEKIHESLVGRKRLFQLNSVSFKEFVNFKTDYRYEDKLEEFFAVEEQKTKSFLEEYLNFGGYPRVIIEEKLAEKRKIINEIFSGYVEKDISYLLGVEKIDAFSSLVRVLAGQVGQTVNYSEISSAIGVSIVTLKNYFWYGEKTFIIQRIKPYFRNRRKEIIKSPVVYFYDLGLRNYCLGLFGNIAMPPEAGIVFENLIFNIINEKLQSSSASVGFWRTKDKAEVDFVINFGKTAVPIEVKYKNFTEVEIQRSLRSFIEKYKPKQAFIINLSFSKTVRIEQTAVTFLPFWKLFPKTNPLFA